MDTTNDKNYHECIRCNHIANRHLRIDGMNNDGSVRRRTLCTATLDCKCLQLVLAKFIHHYIMVKILTSLNSRNRNKVDLVCQVGRDLGHCH